MEEKPDRLMCTPHLKKVLKTYQASATNSLHGPNSVMGVWQPEGAGPSTAVTTSPQPSTSSEDPLSAPPPPFPIQQPPLFTPADQSPCKRDDCLLESEVISCFRVGGEERLCLPQILNSVLQSFSLQQINCTVDALHINCSRCNQAQLQVLKEAGILPANAPSCGLITKTDAQRLCAALLDAAPPQLVVTGKDLKGFFQVQIYHECFGRCTGLYTPDLFVHPHSPCIECAECHALLTPQKFVCHVHQPTEKRTCHWGFDSVRWRCYLHLEIGLEQELQLKEALTEMKERFGPQCKRKQIIDESCDPAFSKRVRIEGLYPYPPYPVDPMLIYYYGPHGWGNTAYHAYPSVITKDGKAIYIPSDSFASFNPKSFRHHLSSLSSATVEQIMPVMKVTEDSSVYHKIEAVAKRALSRKDLDQESCGIDSEDTYSDTSFSTLSGTDEVSGVEEEDELSTESEFLELKGLLSDVDASLRTKIMTEVETLVAKYRKCLSIAKQRKKLYQMQLDKTHYSQRAKLQKLREKNKCLERELQKLRDSVPTAPQKTDRQTLTATPNKQETTDTDCCGNNPKLIEASPGKRSSPVNISTKLATSTSPMPLPKLSPVSELVGE